MPPTRFEPVILASGRPQTHALNHAATAIGQKYLCWNNLISTTYILYSNLRVKFALPSMTVLVALTKNMLRHKTASFGLRWGSYYISYAFCSRVEQTTTHCNNRILYNSMLLISDLFKTVSVSLFSGKLFIFYSQSLYPLKAFRYRV